MACTPYAAPAVSLFESVTQGIWSTATETKGGRTCTHSGGTLTVTAPNGSMNFFAGGSQVVRHKFFGSGNFLAVLTSDQGPGPIQHSMSIVDFTAAAITSQQVLFVGSDSTLSPPWIQSSSGSGSACLIGAPTASGVAGLSILRSDTGDLICAGPPPFTPTMQIIGEATATAVQIKHGGTIVGGPCPFPAGLLTVQPPSPPGQTFDTVKLGGCPRPPSTKQFVLKNSGTDCLTINSIGAAGPYSVTAQTLPWPASLAPNATVTVTVAFAPGAAGTFNNVALPITRNPAKGADKLICSGVAQTAQAAFTATPPLIDFLEVRVGTSANRSLTVKNSGDVPISISIPPAPVGTPFQWAGFSGSLTCGQQQVIPVTFTPQAEGPLQTAVTVASTPGGSQTVTLKGDGCIPKPVISVPAAPFPVFGDVRQGYRTLRFITVENTGDDTLSFTATISGPDAGLFGIMKPAMSITDLAVSRTYSVDPVTHCGGGSTGDGKEELAIVFFANAASPKTANATLTIDSHNDPSAPASFVRPLTANVIAGIVVDGLAVFDTSGSMAQTVQGGGTKMAAAIQAGRLFVNLVPPDLGNRVAATRFSTDATTFLGIGEVTAANQQAKVDAVKDPPLTPNGWTAIAGGVMTAIPEFAAPRAGPAPAQLTKAVVVLTDGLDNTAFKNPADNQYYSLQGNPARDPANPANFIPTHAFVPPAGVKIFAVGLGTGQDIDTSQLAALSSGAGGYYGVVDPTQPATTYKLMKFYTQIYMDLVDTSVIKDPLNTIQPGQTHTIEFDVLNGDVSAMVVVFDIGGLRLSFWLETPGGEIIDASFVPAGFQLRSGYTETSRFLDFLLPPGEPKRYAGRWKLIVRHDGKVCRGRPNPKRRELGFLPGDCSRSRKPVDYGFAIGVGSNFRLQAYLTPGPVNVGDPIRLTGLPTEAGLPVTGCTVTVDAVSPSGQRWAGIVLKDDGGHDDGDANDGEYGRSFIQTAEAGSYTFTFRATGYSRDGEPVNRETVRSKYVEGTIKPPSHTGDGVKDNCCERIIAALEHQSRLLTQLLKTETGEQRPRT